MADVARFTALVRERSRQHQAAFEHLMREGLHAPALSLVRQELDSMIRVIFLLGLSKPERSRLIRASLRGIQWTRPSKTNPAKNVRITDREMADYAQNHHRWVQQVYRYGCNLIHLSDWHGYEQHDPTKNMTEIERNDVRAAMEQARGRHLEPISFCSLLEHAPYAIKKIAGNLECYVKDLERLGA
jgi:hypothetical protein